MSTRTCACLALGLFLGCGGGDGGGDRGDMTTFIGPLLAFRPVDARYSRALDRLVAISTAPDALHVFDPVSQKDAAISLPLAPRCLSVSSDGLFAAVGHDGWISYVDLAAAKVLNIWPVTADAGDVVIGDPITVTDPASLAQRTTRFAYVFPSRDQWVWIHDVDLGTGAEKISSGLIYAGMRAKLQPGSNRIFAIDTQLTPQHLYRFDVGADGITGPGIESSYSDDQGGPTIWISGDGQQILSGGGNRFRATDMSYAGRLSTGTMVAWADWSAESGRWIVQPSGGFAASDPAIDTSFWTVDSEFLSSAVETQYPRYVRAPLQSQLLHGRRVFYDRTGLRHIALVETDGSATLPSNYAVLVF